MTGRRFAELYETVHAPQAKLSMVTVLEAEIGTAARSGDLTTEEYMHLDEALLNHRRRLVGNAS